jgi:hypothetical protein
MIKKLAKQLVYYWWVLNGYLGLKWGITSSQALTVLITYYNPVRMKHVNHQIRNLLQCRFIERVIISNHNPQLRIEDVVTVHDARLTFLNQSVRRGCGHRWLVAAQFSPAYLIVMDDDILLFPWQIRHLFESLLDESNTPHGFAGMVQHSNGTLEYHQRVDQSVDYLCEIYAITGSMLQHYLQMKGQIETDPEIAKSIESTADFVIVSQTGQWKPKIHHSRYLLRCPTFNQAGVAVHRERAFLDDVQAVTHALDLI